MKQSHIILLAAGQGKRMGSNLPKVLQPLAGKPMLSHTISHARRINPKCIHVVVGHAARQVQSTFAMQKDLHWVLQEQQLGTGHATMQALPQIPDEAQTIVLFGDSPLISGQTLETLAGYKTPVLLSAVVPDPSGYGRIIRDADGQVVKIVEHKDASTHELQVNEINSGIFTASAGQLKSWLSQISQNNQQGEYYLTDVVAIAVQQGVNVQALVAEDPNEILGANDLMQLAELERIYQRKQAQLVCNQGVRLLDPYRFDLRGSLKTGSGVVIDANVLIEGDCEIASGCEIGFGSIIRNSKLGPNTCVHPYSIVEHCTTSGDCNIGPYARIRPGTHLEPGSRVGNFVEIKNAHLGNGSKANHLSYVGDALVGNNVNIGAGTITCNYDGVNKHKTQIDDGAFIGSNSSLVAPVVVGSGATIGAGSTITKNAPENQLTLSRARQTTNIKWERPKKKP